MTFRRKHCCCGSSTPCVACSIECNALGGPSPIFLPKYFWFDIEVAPAPNCCGGDWATGCYLLRNEADRLPGVGNCIVYHAVDPDAPDSLLFAPEGDADAEFCGETGATPLIQLTVGSDILFLQFRIAQIAWTQGAGDYTNFVNYVYQAGAPIANYCAGQFVLPKDTITGFVLCWPTDEFPDPPQQTAWPESALLQARDCGPNRECPFDFEPDAPTPCCDNSLPMSLPVRRAGLFPGSGTLTHSLIPSGGGGFWHSWSGTVSGTECETEVQLVCKACTEGDCEGPDQFFWYLSLDGSPLRAIGEDITCDPFSVSIPLDPWVSTAAGSGATTFILACTTLIIGEDDGTIEDVASLTVTLTFTPSNPLLDPYVLPRVLTPDGCNSFSDSFLASSPCGNKSVGISVGLSADKAISIGVSVDSEDFFSGLNEYSCDPFAASFGSEAAEFCSEPGSVTAAIAETPP